ncbi:MAG: JAB domain-containing protein, partial [Bacteroidales bacterium]
VPGSVPSGIKYYKKATNTGGTFYQDESGKVVPFESIPKDATIVDDSIEKAPFNKPKFAGEVIEKGTSEQEYRAMSVDDLVKLKKSKYPNPDITTPMSADEKLLDRIIAEKFSEINQGILEKRKKEKEYGKSNTVFTEDAAAKAREILKRKLGNLNVGIDPEVMMAGIQLAGYHIEAGARKFADFSRAMINDIGEGIRPYLKSFYESIRNWPGFVPKDLDSQQFVSNFDIDNFNPQENVFDRPESSQPDRTNRADAVPGDEESVPVGLGTSREGGTGTQKPGEEGNRGRPGGKSGSGLFTPDPGEPGNQPVYQPNQKPATKGNDARDSYSKGSLFGSTEGVYDESGADQENEEGDPYASKSFAEQTARRLKLQKKAEPVQVVIGDLENIKETLPFLLPEQQDDVLKSETRFFSPVHKTQALANGKGFLFTNGTGTGKTYTGLGIVKRFVKQGKKNVLIVVPTQPKVNDWANDGKNLFLDIKPLPDTSTGGEGIVVTTYANFRANNELLKRDFDLIIYDECHRLMESKAGSASQTTETHYLAANKDFGYAFRRLTGTHPLWIEERKLNKMIRRQAKSMRNPDLMDHIYQEYQKKLDEYEAKLEKIKEQQESVRPGIEERAKQAAENTKVVFLSATPFKSHFNLRYANGFLFDWGNETTYEGYSRVDAESRFFLDHFGSAYEWKFHRLQTKQNANAEAIALQEVQFAEGLFEKGVMSGRVIESERDYSREFPRVAGLQTNDINQAFSDIYNYEANDFKRLRDAARSVFYDYNYSTQLFESLRTSVSIPRIRKHIELGRKVVVFHRRKQANASPPFAMVLAITRNTANGVLNSELSSQKQKDDAMEALTQASQFESKYASLLEYEKTLNYGSAINQISQAFGDRVVYVNGDITSKKTKSDNIRRFQDDNSGVDIIVVQEESGKEGISLHDQTGNRQRVLMSMSMPISSITALQMEGRIYRIGQETDAIFEYPILGLDMEIAHFGKNINKKLSTTENLAVGDQSRDLIRSFAEGVLFSEGEENPNKQQGIGGKEYDKKVQQAMSDFRKAILVYQSNQKNRRSRGQREGVDYFATPEPLGQKMVEWLDLQVEETALEPSAGHGAIAMWFPSFTNITAIEPAFELYSKLNARSGGGNRKIIQSTFEEHNIVNKYDGIVMNPPFGTAGKTAMNHVEKAFRHLRNGGRLVAIVPAGPSMDKRVDNFLYGKDEKGHTINPESYLVGDILLPSVTFEQAGTSVNARVLVIDKHIAPLDDQPNFGSIDLRDAKKIGELFERLEFITVPGKEKPQESSPIPNLSLQTTDRGYILPNKTKEVGQFETFTQSHSQTGETLYMANPSIFLARPEYDRINKIAKKHGGYFSSYSSAVKNIKKGFVFKNEESRTKFLNEAGDASVPLSQGTQPKAGMTVQDVRKIVDKINSVAVNPPKIVVVANDTEFPEKIRQLASFKPNHIRAAVYPEAIYMNASMFSNRDQVVGTWVHEVGVHHGMTRLIPDKDIRDGLFRKVWMSANAHAMRGNEEYKKIIRFINENYPLRSNIEAQKGNEFLAYLSDKVIRGDQLTNADRTIWQQFINKMKELLARLFNFNADVLTTNEISNIVRAAVETNFSSRISKDQSIVNEKENKYNFIQTQINWGEEVSFKRPENVASDPGMSEIQREADYSPDHSNSITFAEDQLSDRGYLTFMGDALTGPARIKSANDVAFLFKNLENASTENVFVVHMDDKGKYKVQYLTTGSSVGSIVPIKHIISAAKEFGATRLVMVHNHPSGNLEQSQNDKLIDEQIRKAAEVVGINALPGIIINLDSGKFAMIGDPKSDIQNKIEVTASIKKQKIYSFDRKKLYVPSSDRTVIRESSDIAEFLSKQKRGIVGKVHAIILDQRNSVTKYILYDGNISTDELSKELLPEIGKSGERVVIASSSNLNLDIRELNRLLKYIDSKLLDYIIVKQDEDIIRNYESWVDRYGSLGESESKYGNEVAKKRNPMFVGDMLKEEKFDQATRKKLNQIEKESASDVAEEPGTELPATITIDGVERSTTNSEGRPIAPTVEGIRNFYRWFGESKVVDAQGRPLVVYHGTRTNFTTFRRGDIGFHFGNKSQARGRVGRGRDAILMPVYLNIKSYADLTTDFGNWEADMDLADKLHEWGVITDEQHAEIESNPVGDYYNGVYSRAARRLVGMIKENGYDGIRYKNRFEAKTAPSFIVFSPSQIKSATGNMGSFDPDNNDIRFRTVSPIGFYSTVENALESIKQGKGTPEQFKAMLLKNGAKQAELDYMDFDGTFTGKSITKSDIQDWIDQNRIEVQEVQKGGFEWKGNDLIVGGEVVANLIHNEDGTWSYQSNFSEGEEAWETKLDAQKEAEEEIIGDAYSPNATKYSQYVLPGGENYREVLLTMPTNHKSYSLIDVKTNKVLQTSNDYEELVDRRNELGG